MMRSLAALAAVLLSSGVAYAGGALAHANRLDTEGDHAGAIREYQALLDAHGYSANLLYDLGTAQLAANETGPAIVSLERARLLAPRDKGIRELLGAARDQAGIAPPPKVWHAPVTSWLSPREWGFLGLGALALFALGLVLFSRWPGRRGLSVVALGASLVIGAVGLTASRLAGGNPKRAIVLTDGAIARQSPFDAAAPRFSLPEGESVTLEKHQGTYAYVRNRTGDHGWLPANSLALVASPVRKPAAGS